MAALAADGDAAKKRPPKIEELMTGPEGLRAAEEGLGGAGRQLERRVALRERTLVPGGTQLARSSVEVESQLESVKPLRLRLAQPGRQHVEQPLRLLVLRARALVLSGGEASGRGGLERIDVRE